MIGGGILIFNWNESFELGIPELDKQHKHLFEVGANLHELIDRVDYEDIYDEIVDNVHELKEYTIFHFNSEEAFFDTYGYSGSNMHKVEHQQFIDYLDGLDLSQVDANQQEALLDLVKFIAKWIFKHINDSDSKYAFEIKQKQQ